MFEEIVPENFSNVEKGIHIQVQKDKKYWISFNPSKTLTRHIIIKEEHTESNKRKEARST
jgi:hypothetical protein